MKKTLELKKKEINEMKELINEHIKKKQRDYGKLYSMVDEFGRICNDVANTESVPMELQEKFTNFYWKLNKFKNNFYEK